MLSELLADYVEERVRQFPKQSFDLAAVKRALGANLSEAEAGLALAPADDERIAGFLDRHPFLVRAQGAAKPVWKPGLDKAAIKGGPRVRR